MSDEKKRPVASNGPATPADNVPVAAEPVPATVEAPAEAVTVATAQVTEADPGTKDLLVPDDRALEVWNKEVRRRMRQKSRRSFLGLGVGLLVGVSAFDWLTTRREIDGVAWPFRKTLEVNEQLARDYFSAGRSAPAFNPDNVSADRVNGDVGLDDDFNVAEWRLEIQGLASEDEPLTLDLDAIKKLPRAEMTTEFKCIEGWSVIVQWAGARFVDLMKAYPPQTRSGNDFSLDHPEDLPPYVSMVTPDGDYYVGLDMDSMLHPQTLLCYERNAAPLTQEHGAPLRLVIPVKYGVKNIKRIGAIRYSTLRPADYWAERGYDWYVGL
ncbi:MAG TPA: molybdopterin-dependent oxidoreductase [Terriglobia bacterium]|nr:molybdopterin-dependent oxidoreductase [Terriglobia bacterium]